MEIVNIKEIMKMREERKIHGPIMMGHEELKFVLDDEVYVEDFQETLSLYRDYIDETFRTDEQDDLANEIYDILLTRYKEVTTLYIKKGNLKEKEFKFYLMSDNLQDSWGADTVTECYEKALKDIKKDTKIKGEC